MHLSPIIFCLYARIAFDRGGEPPAMTSFIAARMTAIRFASYKVAGNFCKFMRLSHEVQDVKIGTWWAPHAPGWGTTVLLILPALI
jgi:hypothetical protein